MSFRRNPDDWQNIVEKEGGTPRLGSLALANLKDAVCIIRGVVKTLDDNDNSTTRRKLVSALNSLLDVVQCEFPPDWSD